jgi:hypothetical protein
VAVLEEIQAPVFARPAVAEDHLAARRALRDQIARLEARVVAISPEFVTRVARTGPWMLSLGELERVRDGLVATLHDARVKAVARAEAEAAARARVEAMLADPAAHRWERVTRAQLGEPGCGTYQVRPRAGLLGMLAGWWEVKLSGGCPLCGGRWPRSPSSPRWSRPSPRAALRTCASSSTS